MATTTATLQISRRLAVPALDDVLDSLGVRPEDHQQVVAHAATLTPADHERIAAAAQKVLDHIGHWQYPASPIFADTADEPGRPRGLLPLMTLLATVPEVRAFHAARGISEEDSWSGLRDLGQQLWVFRSTFGEFGLDTQEWLTCAWSGALYWFGRLQLNLLNYEGRHVLSVHIPQTGPLLPEEVDASFDAARTFFAEHFGDFPAQDLHCSSWLLDPQLVEVLSPTSNMVAFQRRWRLVGEPKPADAATIYFVFRRRAAPGSELDLTGLPRRTTLERAVLDHLDTGGHWYSWTGLIDGVARPRPTAQAKT